MRIHQRFKLIKLSEESLIPIDGNFASTSDALMSEHASDPGEYMVVYIHVLEEEEEEEERQPPAGTTSINNLPAELQEAAKLLQGQGFQVFPVTGKADDDKAKKTGNAKKKNSPGSKSGKK